MYNDQKPNKPINTLISYIVWSIVGGLFLFFVFDELYFKICAFVIPIAVSSFALYAFFNEKKQDKKAVAQKRDMTSGEYFESAEWNEKYNAYKMKHPFEAPKKSSMREDLLKKYRRRDDLGFLVLLAFLFIGSAAGFIYEHELLLLIGIPLFAALFGFVYKDFSGSAVKKWLGSGADFSAVEESYMHGRMLTYKANGINLGTTHILCYKKNDLYAIDHELVEDVTRRIVRVKNYENNIYSGDEYKHYVSISMTDPQSGKPRDIRIELNEFQVQMVIDEFRRMRYVSSEDGTSVGERSKNSISV